MGIFYLIDQSLKGLGGHHFDYTRLLASAAKDAKSTVVIGCHRRFDSKESLPGCDVRNVFRYTTYARCSSLVGIQDMVARRRRGLFSMVKNWLGWNNDRSNSTNDNSLQNREQQNRINTFREDCDQFFKRPLTRDDVVFLTTLSDLEADGLYQFIRSRPDAKLANWHLQFHFPIFRGRTPGYASQLGNTDYLVRTLRKLNTLSQTNIHFYVTSDNLRDQYERTGFGFEELAYPINPEMHNPERRHTGEVPTLFRLAFAGAIRDEKGGDQVHQLIDQFDAEFRSRISLCVQKKRPKLLERVRQWFKNEESLDQVVHIPYPLSAPDYLDHIRNSDIGILTTYDSETYFSRRAGILGEYLAAGVPVIVPAGSWLSDQLEKCQREYLRQITGSNSVQTIRPKTISNRSTGKTVSVFETKSIGQENDRQKFTMAILSFDVEKPEGHGNYFRVNWLGNSDRNEAQNQQIVGIERGIDESGKNRILVAFDFSKANEREFGFEISPAFESSQWQIGNISLTLSRSDQEIPRSVVGLVAADASQTADLAQEIIGQYAHYRNSAADFSRRWFARHDPRLTFQTLINNSEFSKTEKGQAA